MTRLLFIMLALAIAFTLAACGGGDPEDDPDQTIGPVDCKAHPELCR